MFFHHFFQGLKIATLYNIIHSWPGQKACVTLAVSNVNHNRQKSIVLLNFCKCFNSIYTRPF